MGNLLRRVLAFVLGIVFTVAGGLGAVAGGLYWAYKNVKPITLVAPDNNHLGDLDEQTVEELIALIKDATTSPDDFTFARLESEYGIDIEEILGSIGIKDVDTSVSNIKGQGNGKNSIEVSGGIGAINLKFKESEAK